MYGKDTEQQRMIVSNYNLTHTSKKKEREKEERNKEKIYKRESKKDEKEREQRNEPPLYHYAQRAYAGRVGARSIDGGGMTLAG